MPALELPGSGQGGEHHGHAGFAPAPAASRGVEYIPAAGLWDVWDEQISYLDAHWREHGDDKRCAECRRWIEICRLVMRPFSDVELR